MAWLQNNLSTVIVAAVLVLAVALALFFTVRSRKKCGLRRKTKSKTTSIL